MTSASVRPEPPPEAGPPLADVERLRPFALSHTIPFALSHTIPFALSLSKGFVLAGRHGGLRPFDSAQDRQAQPEREETSSARPEPPLEAGPPLVDVEGLRPRPRLTHEAAA